MSKFSACLLRLLCGFLFLMSAHLQALTLLDAEAPSQDIQTELFYWIDPSNQKTLQYLQANPTLWQAYKAPVYSQGYSRSSHWLHFSVQIPSDTQAQTARLLEVNFPFLWLLDLYVLDGERLLYQGHTGAAYPATSRPFEHANFVFPLNLPTNRPLDFYLRTQNDGPITLPITLWQNEAFTTYTGWRQTGFGLYFGIMLALALYNFFLFLSIRSPSYFWYTAHVLGIGLINVSISGFGSQYLWRDLPFFGFVSAAFFSYITNFFALQFTRSFLDSRKVAPRLDKVMWYLGLFHLGYLLIFFSLPKAISLILFTLLSVVSITLILTTGILCFRRGQRTARYFLIGWGLFEVTIAIKLLNLAGVLPNTGVTYYAVMLGSIFEGLLLALALADQINQLKAEQAEYHQKALAASEESNRLKDEFLATISHELRTPMNGVNGALQLLKKECLPAQAESYLELAQLSAQDMLALIDSILGFSEIQSGSLHLASAPFNLAEEFACLNERAQQQARNKGLKLRTTLDVDQQHFLLGDAARLLLIFHHLVDNAIKFTHFGSVSLDLHEFNGRIDFSVTDTGVGIDSWQSKKIFDAFSQVEGAFNRRFGGLGIGLSICHRLLDLMGGKLQFHSELGKGSEFRVTLQLPPITAPVVTQRPNTSSKPRVVVVEDNPVNMQVLTAMLSRLGVDFLPLHNGEDAVKFFRDGAAAQAPVDLVFMDCQMPVIDGFEATRSIRTLHKIGETIPIIAVTANAMSGDRQRCLEAGMNDYIKKPISLEIIRQSLQRWLPHTPQEAEA